MYQYQAPYGGSLPDDDLCNYCVCKVPHTVEEHDYYKGYTLNMIKCGYLDPDMIPSQRKGE